MLIVEDNLDAAQCLRSLLELDGHQVAVAHGVPQGLRLARTFAPGGLLCDIGLPGMSGCQAQAFREDEALRAVYLVALIGRPARGSAPGVRGRLSGARRQASEPRAPRAGVCARPLASRAGPVGAPLRRVRGLQRPLAIGFLATSWA